MGPRPVWLSEIGTNMQDETILAPGSVEALRMDFRQIRKKESLIASTDSSESASRQITHTLLMSRNFRCHALTLFPNGGSLWYWFLQFLRTVVPDLDSASNTTHGAFSWLEITLDRGLLQGTQITSSWLWNSWLMALVFINIWNHSMTLRTLLLPMTTLVRLQNAEYWTNEQAHNK